jgi:hypothetical protein
MSTSLRILAVSALLVSGIPAFTSAAGAAPLGEPLGIGKTAPNVSQTVQWRGGPGPVVGGLIAGAIVGGAIAAGAAPYYGPGYYGPPPVAYGPPPGDAIGYCMQQYRSYDPRSGTYLGYDGFRHPCP